MDDERSWENSVTTVEPARPRTRRPLFARLLVLVLATVLVVGAFRAALVRGLVQPGRVTGSSMAESLVGDHWRITCHDCRFPFRCDADQPPRDGRVICPNCGFGHTLEGNGQLHPGDQVRVDRWPAVRHRFWPTWRRGDVVAFHTPVEENGQRAREPQGDGRGRAAGAVETPERRDDRASVVPRELAIKRIVGMPGERIEIRQGDVWVNGQPWQKSWDEFLRVAVVVHDDRYRPRETVELAERWLPAEGALGWRGESLGASMGSSSGYRFVPAATEQSTASSDPQWLVFRPLAGFGRGPLQRRDRSRDGLIEGDLVPIRDVDFYNQDLSRPLNVVTDMILRSRVVLGDGAELTMELNNGRERLRLTLRPGEPAQLRLSPARGTGDRGPGDPDGESGLDSLGPLFLQPLSVTDLVPAAERPWQVSFGQFDGQVLVAVNDREVYRRELADVRVRASQTPKTVYGVLGNAVAVAGQASATPGVARFRQVLSVSSGW